MRSRPTSALAALVLVAAFCLMAAAPTQPVNAASPASQASSDPQVTAGILLVDVNQVNLITGTYNADFYLWFNSTASPQTVNYEIVNGQATSVTVEANTSTYQEYRVRASITNNMNFQNFPFENHSLSIQIESKNLQASQLTFVADTAGSGTDPSLVVNGWSLLSSSVSAAPHAYSGGQTFSRLTFAFTIGRPFFQTFVKDLLPVILVTFIAMLAFALPPSRSFERVFIGVTTLIATVQLHLALLAQIPSVNYLTIADDVMLTVYTLILYGLGVTIMLAREVDRQDVDKAWRTNRKGAVLVPVVAAVVLAFLFLLGFAGF